MADNKQALKIFGQHVKKNCFDFAKLVYIIFPFGEKGSDLEFMAPYDWQIKEWNKLSKHLQNEETRYETYRLIISSGNGSAKTAFGAMTVLMLLYSQKLKARVTANTDPQLSQIIWPEYGKWFNLARFSDQLFDKFGTAIKPKDVKLADEWKIDRFTWSEQNPTAISGLHNKGRAACYVFEEGPGIPANIWTYASGAFVDEGTIKIFMSFGNSDDPESKFEQNMSSPLWNSLRIDTRTLSHIDVKEIQALLLDCGGDEDHDDFRVRVRGLPRKSAKDSIIKLESVEVALARRIDFDIESVSNFPTVLSIDPAWTGGDECTIWYRRGHYKCLLEKYKLRKQDGETHQVSYNKLCKWERELNADAVIIDQGEGTAIYTLAMNAEKYHWILVSFSNSPTDTLDPKDSEYANIRAMMYYLTNKALMEGGVLDSRKEEWIDDIKKQLCWTKGTRHKITGKKLAESKLDIKGRVGKSPDCFVGDTIVMTSSGEKRIADITVGEIIITPMGNTDVIYKVEKECSILCTVIFSDGNILKGKPSHRVFTWNRGWVRLDSLCTNDVVNTKSRRFTWKIMNLLFTKMKSLEFKRVVDTIAQTGEIMDWKDFYIGEYGPNIMGRFLTIIASIIEIVISVIITFPILRCLILGNTQVCTCKKGLNVLNTEKKITNNSRESEKKLTNGTEAKKEENHIVSPQEKGWKKSKKNNWSVKNVVRNLKHIVVGLNFVQPNVGVNTTVVHINVQHLRKSEVLYDLTLRNHNVYYANGILVENCADGCVLLEAHQIIDKLPENELGVDGARLELGSGALKMGEHKSPYGDYDD